MALQPSMCSAAWILHCSLWWERSKHLWILCDVLYLFTIFQLRLRSFSNQKPKNSFRGILANLNDDQTTDLFWKKMWTNCFLTDSICNPPFHTLSPLLFLTFPPYSYQHCITLHRRSQNITMPSSVLITPCCFAVLYTQYSVHRKLEWTGSLHCHHGENYCYSIVN